MHDPCVATDGHTYERTAIEAWLLQHDTSPMTGLALDDKWLLLSNLLARSLTHEWREINDPGQRLHAKMPRPLPCSMTARRYAELRACGCRQQLVRPEPDVALGAQAAAQTGPTASMHLISFMDRARWLASAAQTTGQASASSGAVRRVAERDQAAVVVAVHATRQDVISYENPISAAI
jgi:hypothetical protein